MSDRDPNEASTKKKLSGTRSNLR